MSAQSSSIEMCDDHIQKNWESQLRWEKFLKDHPDMSDTARASVMRNIESSKNAIARTKSLRKKIKSLNYSRISA